MTQGKGSNLRDRRQVQHTNADGETGERDAEALYHPQAERKRDKPRRLPSEIACATNAPAQQARTNNADCATVARRHRTSPAQDQKRRRSDKYT
ncbi:MAG: hypothetical protein V3T12_09060 [Acidiferrobacterales bacterium]|nr:hypothetical protein [Gammaproteobacteria bacterium]